MCSKSVLFKYFGHKNPFNSFIGIENNLRLRNNLEYKIVLLFVIPLRNTCGWMKNLRTI